MAFRFYLLHVTSFTVCLSIESKCEALYFRSSECSTKTETQTYAENLVPNTPTVCWTKSKQYVCYFHDHRTHCTKCYNEATMNCLSMMKNHDFVCQYSLENNHFYSSQLKITELQNTLSINSYSVIIHWYLLGSYR